ncbi:MAG: PadR family transcriptional regulator [Ekhidna sp.]|nr:PadR family transcriptional regulator [Ekhidna sp.]
MKGTNLGELEELIMLTVALLHDEAYGVAIMKEIKKRCNRISISTVHAALSRLQEKGFVTSRYGGESTERGGRRKHLFKVTTSGQKALEEVKSQRNNLWDDIPSVAFNTQ